MQPQEMNLNSEVLGEFRANMDMALAIMIRQMAEKHIPQGTITAKIAVTIGEHTRDDGEIVRIMKVEPDVGIKIGAKGKLECQEKNGIFVRMDAEGKPIVGSCQIDMDELLQKEENEAAKGA